MIVCDVGAGVRECVYGYKGRPTAGGKYSIPIYCEVLKVGQAKQGAKLIVNGQRVFRQNWSMRQTTRCGHEGKAYDGAV